ncbi:MAG: hypothetical protein CO171_02010 [Syntrophobacterales bacterium CG_4_9_14_3_um_filter_49_8]|nr:MAG: hypothetical protein CO171_02010 [Syntrophobacterales bacterium CG_4_9_14_3_um_filter_49_8]
MIFSCYKDSIEKNGKIAKPFPPRVFRILYPRRIIHPCTKKTLTTSMPMENLKFLFVGIPYYSHVFPALGISDRKNHRSGKT